MLQSKIIPLVIVGVYKFILRYRLILVKSMAHKLSRYEHKSRYVLGKKK